MPNKVEEVVNNVLSNSETSAEELSAKVAEAKEIISKIASASDPEENTEEKDEAMSSKQIDSTLTIINEYLERCRAVSEEKAKALSSLEEQSLTAPEKLKKKKEIERQHQVPFPSELADRGIKDHNSAVSFAKSNKAKAPQSSDLTAIKRMVEVSTRKKKFETPKFIQRIAEQPSLVAGNLFQLFLNSLKKDPSFLSNVLDKDGAISEGDSAKNLAEKFFAFANAKISSMHGKSFEEISNESNKEYQKVLQDLVELGDSSPKNRNTKIGKLYAEMDELIKLRDTISAISARLSDSQKTQSKKLELEKAKLVSGQALESMYRQKLMLDSLLGAINATSGSPFKSLEESLERALKDGEVSEKLLTESLGNEKEMRSLQEVKSEMDAEGRKIYGYLELISKSMAEGTPLPVKSKDQEEDDYIISCLESTGVFTNSLSTSLSLKFSLAFREQALKSSDTKELFDNFIGWVLSEWVEEDPSVALNLVSLLGFDGGYPSLTEAKNAYDAYSLVSFAEGLPNRKFGVISGKDEVASISAASFSTKFKDFLKAVNDQGLKLSEDVMDRMGEALRTQNYANDAALSLIKNKSIDRKSLESSSSTTMKALKKAHKLVSENIKTLEIISEGQLKDVEFKKAIKSYSSNLKNLVQVYHTDLGSFDAVDRSFSKKASLVGLDLDEDFSLKSQDKLDPKVIYSALENFFESISAELGTTHGGKSVHEAIQKLVYTLPKVESHTDLVSEVLKSPILKSVGFDKDSLKEAVSNLANKLISKQSIKTRMFIDLDSTDTESKKDTGSKKAAGEEKPEEPELDDTESRTPRWLNHVKWVNAPKGMDSAKGESSEEDKLKAAKEIFVAVVENALSQKDTRNCLNTLTTAIERAGFSFLSKDSTLMSGYARQKEFGVGYSAKALSKEILARILDDGEEDRNNADLYLKVLFSMDMQLTYETIKSSLFQARLEIADKVETSSSPDEKNSVKSGSLEKFLKAFASKNPDLGMTPEFNSELTSKMEEYQTVKEKLDNLTRTEDSSESTIVNTPGVTQTSLIDTRKKNTTLVSLPEDIKRELEAMGVDRKVLSSIEEGAVFGRYEEFVLKQINVVEELLSKEESEKQYLIDYSKSIANREKRLNESLAESRKENNTSREDLVLKLLERLDEDRKRNLALIENSGNAIDNLGKLKEKLRPYLEKNKNRISPLFQEKRSNDKYVFSKSVESLLVPKEDKALFSLIKQTSKLTAVDFKDTAAAQVLEKFNEKLFIDKDSKEFSIRDIFLARNSGRFRIGRIGEDLNKLFSEFKPKDPELDLAPILEGLEYIINAIPHIQNDLYNREYSSKEEKYTKGYESKDGVSGEVIILTDSILHQTSDKGESMVGPRPVSGISEVSYSNLVLFMENYSKEDFDKISYLQKVDKALSLLRSVDNPSDPKELEEVGQNLFPAAYYSELTGKVTRTKNSPESVKNLIPMITEAIEKLGVDKTKLKDSAEKEENLRFLRSRLEGLKKYESITSFYIDSTKAPLEKGSNPERKEEKSVVLKALEGLSSKRDATDSVDLTVLAEKDGRLSVVASKASLVKFLNDAREAIKEEKGIDGFTYEDLLDIFNPVNTGADLVNSREAKPITLKDGADLDNLENSLGLEIQKRVVNHIALQDIKSDLSSLKVGTKSTLPIIHTGKDPFKSAVSKIFRGNAADLLTMEQVISKLAAADFKGVLDKWAPGKNPTHFDDYVPDYKTIKTLSESIREIELLVQRNNRLGKAAIAPAFNTLIASARSLDAGARVINGLNKLKKDLGDKLLEGMRKDATAVPPIINNIMEVMRLDESDQETAVRSLASALVQFKAIKDEEEFVNAETLGRRKILSDFYKSYGLEALREKTVSLIDDINTLQSRIIVLTQIKDSLEVKAARLNAETAVGEAEIAAFKKDVAQIRATLKADLRARKLKASTRAVLERQLKTLDELESKGKLSAGKVEISEVERQSLLRDALAKGLEDLQRMINKQEMIANQPISIPGVIHRHNYSIKPSDFLTGIQIPKKLGYELHMHFLKAAGLPFTNPKANQIISEVNEHIKNLSRIKKDTKGKQSWSKLSQERKAKLANISSSMENLVFLRSHVWGKYWDYSCITKLTEAVSLCLRDLERNVFTMGSKEELKEDVSIQEQTQELSESLGLLQQAAEAANVEANSAYEKVKKRITELGKELKNDDATKEALTLAFGPASNRGPEEIVNQILDFLQKYGTTPQAVKTAGYHPLLSSPLIQFMIRKASL